MFSGYVVVWVLADEVVKVRVGEWVWVWVGEWAALQKESGGGEVAPSRPGFAEGAAGVARAQLGHGGPELGTRPPYRAGRGERRSRLRFATDIEGCTMDPSTRMHSVDSTAVRLAMRLWPSSEESDGSRSLSSHPYVRLSSKLSKRGRHFILKLPMHPALSPKKASPEDYGPSSRR